VPRRVAVRCTDPARYCGLYGHGPCLAPDLARNDGPVSAEVEVVVKLSPEAAVRDSAEQRAVQARANQLGVPLAPLHPSATDPELASYAVAHVDEAAAEDVIGQLLHFDGVEAAYAKAPGTPPERSARDVHQP
jgi:hypothetical protein